jgi:hypothetical protein
MKCYTLHALLCCCRLGVGGGSGGQVASVWLTLRKYCTVTRRSTAASIGTVLSVLQCKPPSSQLGSHGLRCKMAAPHPSYNTYSTLLYNGSMSSPFELEADPDPTACDRRARSVSCRGGPEGLSADPLLKSGEPWGNKRSSQPIRESLQQVSVSH